MRRRFIIDESDTDDEAAQPQVPPQPRPQNEQQAAELNKRRRIISDSEFDTNDEAAQAQHEHQHAHQTQLSDISSDVHSDPLSIIPSDSIGDFVLPHHDDELEDWTVDSSTKGDSSGSDSESITTSESDMESVHARPDLDSSDEDDHWTGDSQESWGSFIATTEEDDEDEDEGEGEDENEDAHADGDQDDHKDEDHEDQSPALLSEAAVQAALKGNLSAIETMYAQDHIGGRLPEVLSSHNAQLCKAAARNGHLHILKWALQHRLPRDERVFRAAYYASEDHPDYSMRHRRMDVVKWLRHPGGDELPCPAYLNGTLCKVAAAQGDIGMLTWLRAQGCCWGSASQAAFRNTQVDTLFWITSQEPPCRWTGPRFGDADPVVAAAIKAAATSGEETADKAAFLDILVACCLKHLWGGRQNTIYIAKLVVESGRLGPMRWLMKHECKDLPEDAGAVLFVAAAASNQEPPAKFPKHPEVASDRCFIILAKLVVQFLTSTAKGALAMRCAGCFRHTTPSWAS
ncbi:hypothetical protein WJX74_003751 [Apatococcus lobatus]|uniref:Ankyrin repeat protein n=1 Tax=Apatococcus lobatus TaxID=904363 RepID=A0AAW1RLH1_9CHLO